MRILAPVMRITWRICAPFVPINAPTMLFGTNMNAVSCGSCGWSAAAAGIAAVGGYWIPGNIVDANGGGIAGAAAYCIGTGIGGMVVIAANG